MIYFKFSYNSDGTKSWEEYLTMSEDAKLLVRAVGLNFVNKVLEAIEAYRNKINQDVVVFTEAERKDDVSFFVKPEQHRDITSFCQDFTK